MGSERVTIGECPFFIWNSKRKHSSGKKIESLLKFVKLTSNKVRMTILNIFILKRSQYEWSGEGTNIIKNASIYCIQKF